MRNVGQLSCVQQVHLRPTIAISNTIHRLLAFSAAVNARLDVRCSATAARTHVMATFLSYKLPIGLNHHRTARTSHNHMPCRPALASTPAVPTYSSYSARAPSWVVRVQPSERERDHEAAQGTNPMETASTNKNRSQEVPTNLVADVDGTSAEQEAAVDRIGSHTAAQEKAPDSERNQEYQEPLAGEGASAAD